MQTWQLPLLGRRRFPADLSAFEIEHFFTFSAVELANIRSRATDRHRVAVAIHIGFIRMSGRHLQAIDAIPRDLLAHIGAQLDIVVPDLATLRTLYRRDRTLAEHQNHAARILGFQKLTEHRRRALLAQLRKDAHEAPSVPALADRARRWLYDRCILLPGRRALLDIVRRAHAEIELALLEAVKREVGLPTLVRWEEQIFAARGSASTLEWLQAPPLAGLPGLRHQIERIETLTALGLHRIDLAAVRLERQRHYARLMRRRRPARFRALSEARRVLEMSTFLRVSLLQCTDTALAIAERLVLALHARATREVRTEQIRSSDDFRDVLRSIRELVRDESVADTELRRRIDTLMPFEHELYPSRAAAVRWRLAELVRPVRQLLLLLKLEFRAASGSPLIGAIAHLRSNPRGRELPRTASAEFAPRWAHIIDGPDRRWALRGFEAAVLITLRQSLRNGTVWVSHSLEYRKRSRLLLSDERWSSARNAFLTRHSLPAVAAPYIEKLSAGIELALASLDEALAARECTIDQRGIHLSRLVAEERPDQVDRVIRAIAREIAPVQLPDLIVAVDQHTRFSWALLGREPRSEQEVLTVYAGLLAHGTELDAHAVSLMIPGLSEEAVGSAMRLLEEESHLREANERVLAFQQRHSVVRYWGDGTSASSDAMSLDASRHLWSARVDPKRRRYGVGIYTHVLDRWGIIYDQPIVVTQREAGAAIEGAVRQSSTSQLERVATDTHGHTDFGMALARLLGFDLCPRLKNLRDRRLHVPRGIAVPESLRRVVDHDVSLPALEGEWEELLRVAASVEGGWTSAVLALQRFGTASRKDPVYKAGRALGQLLRTVYLCDYFTNTDFRREVSRILDHGESIHQLQRVIYFGGIAAARGRRREELVAISGSLALLCNLVIAWKTHEIQRVVDEWRRRGRQPALDGEIIRHLSPARTRGVNMRGVMSFPIARYRERLIPAAEGR